MAKVQSWEVSDLFWGKVEPLIPPPTRDHKKHTAAKRVAVENRFHHEGSLKLLFTYCAQAASGKRFPKNGSAAPALFTPTLRGGCGPVFLPSFGRLVSPSTTIWRA